MRIRLTVIASLRRHRSLPYLIALALLLLAFYWPAASLQYMFHEGDMFRLNYPLRAVYATALRQDRIPLWTSDALAGYPILAEGQPGALYPLNLILYRILPLVAAINYSSLISYWIAGAGLFLYTRRLGLRRGPAFLAACVFVLGGFMPAHLVHMNIVAGASWLPLLLWAIERAAASGCWRDWAPVSILFALQVFAGHPQMSLLSALLAGLYAIVAPLAGSQTGSIARRTRQLGLCIAALAVSIVLALPHLGPLYELTTLSQRAQRLDYDYFTVYSMSLNKWLTMARPFPKGNPTPFSTQEPYGYVGALPLVFGALALLRRRDRSAALWTGVAALAFSLALGKYNPAYRLIWYVPIVNRFRVPARYLLWLDLALAILAAMTFDSLFAYTRKTGYRGYVLAAGTATLLIAPVALWATQTAGADVAKAWCWLYPVWFIAALALLLALRWRPPAPLWGALVIGLSLANLVAWHGVYSRTSNEMLPSADVLQVPETLAFLQADAGSALYRIYTYGKVQTLATLQEALYPDTMLVHGMQSLNGYFPLTVDWQRWLSESLNWRLLQLMNVRYVLIPQAPPSEGPAESYNSDDPFTQTIVGNSFAFDTKPVQALEVEGYLSDAADLADGTPVAEVIIKGADGEETLWTLRAGYDLADWAYMREDVRQVIRHRQPATVVRSWPAQSGNPPREHVGQTYLAHWSLPQTMQATGLEVRPLIPHECVQIERLRLIDPTGRAELLSSLTNDGDHTLVYRSPSVAIYRDDATGPRAFLVHKAQVRSETAIQKQMASETFSPWQEVLLLDGQELMGSPSPRDQVTVEVYQSEYIRLRAVTDSPAYLVLADTYYPGWAARVDGQPTAIQRADVALRAVALPAGEHEIDFSFQPRNWRSELALSAACWAALGAFMLRRRPFALWAMPGGR